MSTQPAHSGTVATGASNNTVQHPSLRHAPSNLIGGKWEPLSTTGPGLIVSTNPARPDQVIWQGCGQVHAVDRAVAAARGALEEWSSWSFDRRKAVLLRFASLCDQRVAEATQLLIAEVGKVAWDSAGEAGLLGGKVAITLENTDHSGLRRVSDFALSISPTRQGKCWFRPHGVMGVIGPFNFPMHLPNGHIVPALLMGNTVVFKPSDKAPACGQLLAELFDEALAAEGAPAGVVNLVQGGRDVAVHLGNHEDTDGLLFTGSWPVGRALLEANLDRPGRMVALELGGNNAGIVLADADLALAAAETVRTAFITTGQRCTCMRRVIVEKAVADRFIAGVVRAASELVVGPPDSQSDVFMGPLISEEARDSLIAAQHAWTRQGGDLLLEARPLELGRGGWFVSPGIMRVDRFTKTDEGPGCDQEVFGPFLRISVVNSYQEALEQANATRYGLAASLFTRNQATIEHFMRHAKAGCVNINNGTAGASSKLPFGGLGQSGNHRPAGSFSLDYCAFPTAGLVDQDAAPVIPKGMSFDASWLQ